MKIDPKYSKWIIPTPYPLYTTFMICLELEVSVFLVTLLLILKYSSPIYTTTIQIVSWPSMTAVYTMQLELEKGYNW